MLTLIYFILILGAVVFIHELGHFTFAKLFKVHVYEFSIGMGPRIFKLKRKNDETEYSIRALPIGGYVSMAGESSEVDQKVAKGQNLQDKNWFQRFMIMFAGILNNFIFAFVILFVIALILGAPSSKPIIGTVSEGYPIAETGITVGDTIVKVNNTRINTVDRLLLELHLKNGQTVNITVRDKSGQLKTYQVAPKKIETDGETSYRYGIGLKSSVYKGFFSAISYAVQKIYSLVEQMIIVIGALFTGRLSLSGLSGPVGIYGVVGQSAKAGIASLFFLTAYLSVNVGFINLLPFPALDGGRIFLLIIEKIKGSPISMKVENAINIVGFVLLMILMIVITFNDIIKLIR